MRTFTFYDEGYYDQPGCSCCDGSWVEAFNSSDTDCNLGSAHSEEDCYVQAIITDLGYATISEEYKDELYQMSLKSLKQVAIILGIEVKIIS